jgi:carboxymethylenebutenolidase
MPDTTYQAPAGRLRGYLATPAGDGPWAAVVVIHEALGMVDDIRRAADKLADAGYLAFAPDLFSYGFAPACLLTTFRTLTRGGQGGRVIDDIDAAREFVLGQPGCSGKVGIIGFCMGGGFAILAANRGYDVSAPNYGPVPRDAETALAGACPMVASYGAKDSKALRGTAHRLETTLTELGVEHDVKEYPDVGHAFMNRINVGPALNPVMRFVRMNYHHPSAEDAWQRILIFFDAHLG